MLLTVLAVFPLLSILSSAKHVSYDADNEKYADERPELVGPVERLETAFTRYVFEHEYSGASLGVMYGDRLVYADGRGYIHGREADGANDVVPILGLSKTLTAVGIMKLVESGVLDLSWKVFGKRGILAEYTGPHGYIVDPAVEDITVHHLLHHTAGWDEASGPIYDPMHNKLLVEEPGDREVVDIKKALALFEGEPDQFDILTFMLGERLDFVPGSKAKPSNFGYSVLGRVIEEVTELPYEYWVKKNILEPAGMWHTRIGPTSSMVKDGGSDLELDDAMTLDSTLGWYSNVYDIARFLTCLFKSGVNDEFALLTPETLTDAMQRPKHAYPQHTQHWYSMGFVVAHDGSFYLESTELREALNDGRHHMDVFLYHKQSEQYKQLRERDPQDAFTFDYVDDSTVIFLGRTGRHHKHMRNLARDILDPLTPDIYMENAYLKDLGDDELQSIEHDVMVKYKLNEHHLIAYASALRMAGYYPTWLHGYHYNGHSYYTTIFERATEITQLYYKLFVSSEPRHIVKFITDNEKHHYHVSFLQSFVSGAHDDSLTHLIVLSLHTDHNMKLKFDFGQEYNRYMTKLSKFEHRGFAPVIQSADMMNDDIFISYLLEKVEDKEDERQPSRSFINVSAEELRLLTEDNAKNGYSLSYLDTFQQMDEPRFSVIFRYQQHKQWLLQDDVSYERLTTEANKWNGQDYKPKMMVGFVKDGELHYAGLWVNDHTMIGE